MAKAIKFNLICDEKPIRTLDGLRNNFSVEDILAYYQNGLLQRWLNVRGYAEELKKVEALKANDDLAIVKALIGIFEVEVDPTIIEKHIYILGYRKEREKLIEEHAKKSYKVSSVLDAHFSGYNQLIEIILRNKHDMAQIKAAIKEIDEEYHNLFEYDFRTLYYTFLTYAPMAVFIMLMRPNMRKKYLPQSQDNVGTPNEHLPEALNTRSVTSVLSQAANNNITGQETHDENEAHLDTAILEYTKEDQVALYKSICSLLSNQDKLSEALGDNLRIFAGVTEEYWKDVEPKGKQCLILQMQPGNLVRASGVSGGDMKIDEIKEKFVILDGIDYKSKNASHALLYLEV